MRKTACCLRKDAKSHSTTQQQVLALEVIQIICIICLDVSETVIGLPQNSLHVLSFTLLNSVYMKGLVAIY